MSNPEESESFVAPPTALRVKARLMLHCAHWLRSGWEMGEGDHLPPPELIHEWVSRLAPEAEEADLALHALPVGQWTPQQAVNASWTRQSAGVFEWALGLHETAVAWDEAYWWSDISHDEFPDFPDPDTWRPELILRPEEDIEREAMIIETCYWRLRPGREIRPDGVDYVKKLLRRAAELGHVSLAPDGDLLCSDGRSLADRSDDDAQRIRSILMEKLQALNWLRGDEDRYDDVTCDTTVSWLWDHKDS